MLSYFLVCNSLVDQLAELEISHCGKTRPVFPISLPMVIRKNVKIKQMVTKTQSIFLRAVLRVENCFREEFSLNEPITFGQISPEADLQFVTKLIAFCYFSVAF